MDLSFISMVILRRTNSSKLRAFLCFPVTTLLLLPPTCAHAPGHRCMQFVTGTLF